MSSSQNNIKTALGTLMASLEATWNLCPSLISGLKVSVFLISSFVVGILTGQTIRRNSVSAPSEKSEIQSPPDSTSQSI